MRTLDELGISPAPWRVNDREYGAPNEIICDYIGDRFVVGEMRTRVIATTNHNFPESEADACIIKSSPRMYEALRKLLKFLDGDDSESPSLKELISEGHAAIAEASGESEEGETK